MEIVLFCYDIFRMKKPRFIIDCADHEGFVRLANEAKTILTRANRSSAQSEDYALSEPEDILELVDNQTGKKLRVKVVNVINFKSISDLFHNSNIPEETFDKRFRNEEELRNEYEKNRPGYTKIIERNGLVAWRIKLLKDKF
jgi:hypothetical protein